MKRILILSNINESSPSIRYRLMYILDILKQKRNINYKLIAFFSQKTFRILDTNNQFKKIIFSLYDGICFVFAILFCFRLYDIIIVKNYLFPIGGCKIEKIFYYLLKNRLIIYDIDDAIYLNETRKQNKIFSYFRNAEKKVHFWTTVSTKIFISNKIILNDLIKQYHLNANKCKLFLSCPYEKQYFDNSAELTRIKRNSNIRLVWLGSPHTEEHLKLFETVIIDLPKYFCNVKIILIGASAEFTLFENLNHVEVLPWTPEIEYTQLRLAHFGLNPLCDNKFERRKSAFKVIQYYRAGVIPIVSNVGLNEDLINKYGGFCIKNLDDIINVVDFIKIQRNLDFKECKEVYRRTMSLTVEHNSKVIENEMFFGDK